MDLLPVVGLRLLDGRVGSTLLMQLLGTADEVVFERRYPEGEYRYLSYCLRQATWVRIPWESAVHPGVTDLHFGPDDRTGPLPFTPTLVDPARLGPAMLEGMWAAVSAELRRTTPTAAWYAEKLAGDTKVLFDSAIPLQVVDLVRDPRDVFRSIRAFSAGEPAFGRRHDQSDNDFLDRMALVHRSRLRAVASTPEQVRRILVRYEDLVGDLPGTARRLEALLGVRLDPDRVHAARAGYGHHVTTASAAESVGRWRRELSPDQATRLWDLLGPELEALGYPQQ